MSSLLHQWHANHNVRKEMPKRGTVADWANWWGSMWDDPDKTEFKSFIEARKVAKRWGATHYLFYPEWVGITVEFYFPTDGYDYDAYDAVMFKENKWDSHVYDTDWHFCRYGSDLADPNIRSIDTPLTKSEQRRIAHVRREKRLDAAFEQEWKQKGAAK